MAFQKETDRRPKLDIALAKTVQGVLETFDMHEIVSPSDLMLIEVEAIESDLSDQFPFNEQGYTPQILLYYPGGISRNVQIRAHKLNRNVKTLQGSGSEETLFCLSMSGIPGGAHILFDGMINQPESTEKKFVTHTEIGDFSWENRDTRERAIPLLIFKKGFVGSNLHRATTITLPIERTQNVSSNPQVEQPQESTDVEAIRRLVEFIDDSMPPHNDRSLPPGTKVAHVDNNLVEVRIEYNGPQPRIRFNYEMCASLVEGFLFDCGDFDPKNVPVEELGWEVLSFASKLSFRIELTPGNRMQILATESLDLDEEPDWPGAQEISPRLFKRILDITKPGYPEQPQPQERRTTPTYERPATNFDAIRALNRVVNEAFEPIVETRDEERKAETYMHGLSKAEYEADQARKRQALEEVGRAIERQRAKERAELEPYLSTSSDYTPPVRHEVWYDKPGKVEPVKKAGSSGPKLSYGQRHPENRKNGPGSIDRKHNKKRQIEGLKKIKDLKKGRNY